MAAVLRALPGVVTFAVSAGLQVSGMINRWVGYGLMIFGAVLALVWVMLPKPRKEHDMAETGEPRSIHVESHNQQGGITAGEVHIQQQTDRKLTQGTATSIEQTLKAQQFKSIDVACALGDGEAYNFASQIYAYLKSKGYTVAGVSQAVWVPPIQGQVIIPAKDDGVLRIRIGSRQR